ncbi:MAG: cobalt transporter CbiM [Syntrophomonas sp.]
MHIPDGYLSPQTALPLLAVMVPVWGVAVKKVKENLKKKEVPVLAIGAAFSFTIMMFNLPIPGGSSAHAVGAVLLAILLGPWSACIGVSIALTIQALVFNDGGIMAIGANCFNMGVIMPFIGYYCYRLLKGNAEAASGRGLVAAAVAGYVGLNIAALFTAIEFGSQYHLFQAADGTPLYFPFSLKVAVAAMMSEHMLLAGPVEALVTALGLSFVSRNYPELLSQKLLKVGNGKWGVESHV